MKFDPAKMMLSKPQKDIHVRICQAIYEGRRKEIIADDLRVSLRLVYWVQEHKCPSCNPVKMKL